MKEFRRGPKPIGDLVRRTLDELGVPRSSAKLELLRAAWPKAAGPGLAGKTDVVTFRDQVLTIRAANSALRYEIESFHRERILEALRREAPDVVVSQIRVRG